MIGRLSSILLKISGLVIIGFAFYYVTETKQVMTEGELVHFPSLILIASILVGVALCSYQPSVLLDIVKNLVRQSPSALESQMASLNQDLQNLSEAYYKSNAVGLQRYVNGKKLPSVWRTVFNQLEAKIPAIDIRTLLNYDAREVEENFTRQIGAVSFLSSIAPSAGVLGTVLGLIRLLAQLEDLSSLGPNMSLALVTTLYGLLASVLILSPIASRLEIIRDLRLKSYQQALFWVHLIENRRPSFYCDPRYWKS